MRMMLGAMVMAIGLVPAFSPADDDVSTEVDKNYDFSRLKTFHVKLGTPWRDPVAEGRLVAEVTEALAARGLRPVPDEPSADALVVVHGATEKRRSLTTFYDGWGGWGYWGWGHPASSTTTVKEYRVGTLIVDVFDAHTKQLVFRGTATDELSHKPAKNVKKVEKATAKMFKDFPAQASLPKA